VEKYDDLSTCDIVIETATEKDEVKPKIFDDLCASLKADAISNTSLISNTRLASSTGRRPPLTAEILLKFAGKFGGTNKS
jgi:3-hydroxybutyryl-CoA dehydrogenase